MRIWRVRRKLWRTDLVDELVDEGGVGELSALLVEDHFERRPDPDFVNNKV